MMETEVGSTSDSEEEEHAGRRSRVRRDPPARVSPAPSHVIKPEEGRVVDMFVESKAKSKQESYWELPTDVVAVRKVKDLLGKNVKKMHEAEARRRVVWYVAVELKLRRGEPYGECTSNAKEVRGCLPIGYPCLAQDGRDFFS